MNLESAHSDLSIGVPLGETEPVLAPGNLFEDGCLLSNLIAFLYFVWQVMGGVHFCRPSSSTRDLRAFGAILVLIG